VKHFSLPAQWLRDLLHGDLLLRSVAVTKLSLKRPFAAALGKGLIV
jgi:hypothetical protein